jgi:hypothetical protein
VGRTLAWIESHQALGHHPKTIRLAAELHVSLPTAVGHLHYLWWWALEYAPDGRLCAGSELMIARACQWHGKTGRFWSGLVSAGFVEADLAGYQIHDWYDFAGKLVEQRALRRVSNRAAQERRRQRFVSADVSADKVLSQQEISADRDDSQHPTVPDRTGPNHVVVRVEESPAPARAREAFPLEAGPRGAAVAQDCPICRRTFIGPYSEHECAPINRPPRRLGRVLGASTLSRKEIAAAEAELEQHATARSSAAELPPDLLAEDARLRAAERARSPQEPA